MSSPRFLNQNEMKDVLQRRAAAVVHALFNLVRKGALANQTLRNSVVEVSDEDGSLGSGVWQSPSAMDLNEVYVVDTDGQD